MGPRAYYNEIDPFAAAWLSNLIARGLIAPGDVDERDIRDVHPDDLRGYRQAHFFAGIGVWSYALRRAGWSDDRPVWTGSCPCQPFSSAGRGDGFADERHLWPAWFHLIRERRPSKVFGEQVASRDGLAWLDLVQADMEGEGYAIGAADLCAASVGAPHIRQRLWFVADAGRERRDGLDALLRDETGGRIGAADPSETAGRREARALADVQGHGRHGRLGLPGHADDTARLEPQRHGTARGVAKPNLDGLEGPVWRELHGSSEGVSEQAGRPGRDPWADADWLWCRDGKARPVESGTFPLAHGAPARVGRLRGYGNAINAEAATAFIRAADAALADLRSVRVTV